MTSPGRRGGKRNNPPALTLPPPLSLASAPPVMASASEPGAEAGLEPLQQALKEGLEGFYGCHNASKVDTVPGLLERFQGRERDLVVALAEKYGDEATRAFRLPALAGALLRAREGEPEEADEGKNGLSAADAGAPLVSASGEEPDGVDGAAPGIQALHSLGAGLAEKVKTVGAYMAEQDVKATQMALRKAQAARSEAQMSLRRSQGEAQELRNKLAREQRVSRRRIEDLEKDLASARRELQQQKDEAAAKSSARRVAEARADEAEGDAERCRQRVEEERRRADEACRASDMEALRRLLAGSAADEAAGEGEEPSAPGAEEARLMQQAQSVLGEGDAWTRQARSALMDVYAAALAVDAPEEGGDSDEEGGGGGDSDGADPSEPWLEKLQASVQKLPGLREAAPTAVWGEGEVVALAAWSRVAAHADRNRRRWLARTQALRWRATQAEHHAAELESQLETLRRDAASRGMETVASRSELKRVREEGAAARKQCEELTTRLGRESEGRGKAEKELEQARAAVAEARADAARSRADLAAGSVRMREAEEEAREARDAAACDAAVAMVQREHAHMAAEDAVASRRARWERTAELAGARRRLERLGATVDERDAALESLAERMGAVSEAALVAAALKEGVERQLMNVEDGLSLRREVEELSRAVALAKARRGRKNGREAPAAPILLRVGAQ